MANLDMTDKDALGHLLRVRDGYIIGFEENEDKFAKFFLQFGVDINSRRYAVKKSGRDSQFSRFQKLLEKDADKKVGKIISALVKHVEFSINSAPTYSIPYGDPFRKKDDKITYWCIGISERLLGKHENDANQKPIRKKANKKDFFVDEVDREIDFSKIPIEKKLSSILKSRLDEAALCFDNGVYLSAIIMAGSVLEGVLLGYAMQNREKFNQSKCCPKDNKSGKPRPFNDWSLAQLIDAAKEIGALNDDMKKFGHSLREYRNYIHPHEQLKEGFKAGRENAHLCLQALIYALKSLMTK